MLQRPDTNIFLRITENDSGSFFFFQLQIFASSFSHLTTNVVQINKNTFPDLHNNQMSQITFLSDVGYIVKL